MPWIDRPHVLETQVQRASQVLRDRRFEQQGDVIAGVVALDIRP